MAAVQCPGRQGSGYLLSPTVVLTAAHVVAGAQWITAIVPGGRRLPCTPLWADPDRDVALLLAAGPLTGEGPGWSVTRWGDVCSGEPVKDCQAIGYPFGAGHERRLVAEQFTGTLKPVSGRLSGRYVLDFDHTPPTPRDDGRSPWAGLSGAAVFAGRLLVGVAVEDAAGFPHSRIAVTPAAGLLGDTGFRAALARGGCPVPELGSGHPDDEPFERSYARWIVSHYNELTIYGLDVNHGGVWPLDASYLSLELLGTKEQPTPPRADEALSRHPRVLLRGVAGSGKTTLAQWLAVAAAQGAEGDGPAYLHGRIPFVLPLRRLGRGGERIDPPGPDGFLSGVGCHLADRQPPGWAERVLSAGRGLLLVDGVDEIAEGDRKDTRLWLQDLVREYPGNLWLVTSRPSAVADDWLARGGFTQFDLAPMHRDGVTDFVRRWHEASGAGDCLREDLLAALRTKQDLARLATNPLLCGLICALHRDRRGYLPHNRKELYEAALSMLLERRDKEKGIHDSFGGRLTKEPQIRLLQKLAYWMIRNHSAELDRDRAERIIADVLPAVPSVAALGGAGDILHHLLLRSGLLREPAEDAVDFVHRTFQDFLAAKAAVEEGDFGLLLHHAGEPQWEDVIRMAVAHARPRESGAFLDELIKLEDRRSHLLAMACLEDATELAQDVRERVRERASHVIPPRSFQEAAALREVGPMVLELLDGPNRLTEEEAGYVLETAAGIADDAALPLLARFCAAPWPRIRERVVDAWELFDADRYAQEVLLRLPADDVLVVRDTDQLAALRWLGGRERLELRGEIPAAAMASTLFAAAARELVISRNRGLNGAGFLGRWRGLRRLAFQKGTGGNPASAADWEVIGSLPELRELKTTAQALGCLGPARVDGLERLALTGGIPFDTGTFADRLAAFPALSVLDLSEAGDWRGRISLPRGLTVIGLSDRYL